MNDERFIDTFKNHTGIVLHIRQFGPEDAPYLVNIFENMGGESRYNRFMESVQNVTIERIWDEAEAIAHGARGETYGLLAFADLPGHKDAPVGAARYVKLSATEAEFALSVRDDMQGTGIGTHLLHLLVDKAAETGVHRLVGVVLNNNQAMWHLLKKLGYRLESHPEGSYSTVIVHIQDSPVLTRGWPDTAEDFSPEPQIIW